MAALTRTHTYTHAHLFDHEQVDATVGKAYRELESEYLRRKEHIPQVIQRSIEARLELLRHTWLLMLEDA